MFFDFTASQTCRHPRKTSERQSDELMRNSAAMAKSVTQVERNDPVSTRGDGSDGSDVESGSDDEELASKSKVNSKVNSKSHSKVKAKAKRAGGSGLAKISKPRYNGNTWTIGKDHVPRRKPAIVLEPGQQSVVDYVRKGKSVFFTGVAGTGKSFLIDYLVNEVLPKETTFVTASTGIAAVNISGSTLNSFAGIGDGKGTVEEIVAKIKSKALQVKKWKECKVLIIDEISMISGMLFDKIEAVARLVRGIGRPFGGILVIGSGDFLQLPPVERKNGLIDYAFESNTWNRVFPNTVLLTTVRRQNDCSFVKHLNEIRKGKVTPECVEFFSQCIDRKFDESDGIKPTILYPTKKEVALVNNEQLDALPGKEMIYPALPTHAPKCEKLLEALMGNFGGEAVMRLKKGAQVILTKNLNPAKGLVNGSRGIVINFAPARENNEDSGSDHEEGSDTDRSNTKVESKLESKIKHPKNDAEHKRRLPRRTDGDSDDSDSASSDTPETLSDVSDVLADASDDAKLWPVVKFTCGVIMTIVPDKWEITQQTKVLAKVEQVPLLLGWALTMHKSQGMTLDRVRMSMRLVFEYAQAYVALSRVKTIGGLCIEGLFNVSSIKTHPRAKKFYDDIEFPDGVPKEEKIDPTRPTTSTSSTPMVASATPTVKPRAQSSFLTRSSFKSTTTATPTSLAQPRSSFISSSSSSRSATALVPASSFISSKVTQTASTPVAAPSAPSAPIAHHVSRPPIVLQEPEGEVLSDWE